MLSRRAAWAVTIAATATMTVSYVDRAAFGALSETITKQLHISNTEYGWLGTAFAFAYLVSTPVAGWWIDRVGARRGLVGSVLVWSTIAGLHALVPGFWSLFALRIMLGLAEGPGFPSAAQTVHRVLPENERERGFGVLFTGSSLGWMIAGPLASLLYVAFGWRVALVQTAVVGLAWVPVWLLVTRPAAVRERLDQRPPPGVQRDSLVKLVSHPVLIRAFIAILTVAPVVGFLQQWGSKYLIHTFDVTQGEVGGYTWLAPLFLDVGAILFGDLASRLRRGKGEAPRGLFAIATILAASMMALPLAGSAWQGVTIVGISMAGGGAIYALTTSDMLSRLPSHQVSFAGGILACAQSIAAMAMHPLIGSAVDTYDNYDGVGIALGAVVIPGAIVWLAWRPRPYGNS